MRGSPNGIFGSWARWNRARPNGQSSWDVAAAVAAAAVTWKFRLTFRPGNYIQRFSHGFGLLVRDLGKWRPGFYSEFRCASHERRGLLWGAIFEKNVPTQEINLFENCDVLRFWKCQVSRHKSPCGSLPPRLHLFRIYCQGGKGTKMIY